MQGFISKTNVKDGKGKRGTWYLYSFLMELDDGTESKWISAGFDKPPFAEGSYGSVETTTGEYGLVYTKDSWKSLPVPAAQPKAAPASSPAPTPRAGSHVDRNDSIVYQSSRKDAIALVSLLLEHDALPMSANAAKAGIAKRFEEITAYVDKITVQYYHDVQTGRTIQSVVDAGAVPPSSAGIATNSSGSTEPDND